MKKAVSVFILGLLFTLSGLCRSAEAALQVWPHLVEMDARNRTANLTLTNLGVTEERYRISLGFIALGEDGRTAEITPGPEHPSAIELIRFMPRSVTLAPGEHQVVRLRLSFPPGLEEGEYRAHIFFEEVPPPRIAAPLEEAPPEGITVKLTALQRVGIPIMVEKGELFKEGELSEFNLKEIEGRPYLSFRVSSTGSRSLRGDIEVEKLPRGGGSSIPLFLMRNFVVHTPGTRIVTIPLVKEGLALEPGSRLRIIYRERWGGPIITQAEIEI